MPPDGQATTPFASSVPAARLHLLDASMFWGSSGGVRRVLSTKHRMLPERGWRHTVLAPGAEGEGEGFIDCGGVALPASGGYRLVLKRRHAQDLIESARPDIVESADPYTLAWAVLGASERLQVPAVAFCHSNLPALAARLAGGIDGLGTQRGRWAARRARAYLVRLYTQFDLVLAPSLGLVQRLRHWGVEHATHQPLGVDTRIFNPQARNPAWRQRLCMHLGLHPYTRLVVYSGRFSPEKNLPLVTEAVRLLGAGVALLAVGAGPLPPRGSNVFTLRAETDSRHLARLLASCDAYVHAGDQETFGLGALEAMACGTPVVVADAGGLRELAQDVGIVVHRQRALEWAEAIHACLADSASPLPYLALDKARQHDWSRVMDQLSRRYGRLLRRHARAGIGRSDAELADTQPLPLSPMESSLANPRLQGADAAAVGVVASR
jgi:alpha-1,6-mannosyltransferase